MQKCLGIPVRYDEHYNGISDSRGLWRWKEIVIGPTFNRFDPRERQAILLHEVGHCKLKHLEKRLWRLWLLVVSPARLARFCETQEFEADAFVTQCGYAADLARVFLRLSANPAPLHPPLKSRMERLFGVPTQSLVGADLTSSNGQSNVPENQPART